MTTETTALVRQLRAALDAVAPHTDKLICYASTAAEHPENLIDGQVQAAIAAADQWLAQQRGPLTDKEIARMWMAGYSDGSGDSMVNLFARAIERAHGIGLPTVEDKPC